MKNALLLYTNIYKLIFYRPNLFLSTLKQK